MYRARLVGVVLACLAGGVVVAQGPLTPIGQLRGRTDSNGALMTTAAVYSGVQGPLTPIAQLQGRTDSSGNLLVTVAGGTGTFGNGSASAPSIAFAAATNTGMYRNTTGNAPTLVSGGQAWLTSDPGNGQRAIVAELGWTSASNMTASAAADIILARDAAATLALKNGTTAQAFRVYGTTTGPKYLSLSHDGTNGVIDTAASSGLLSIAPTNATSVAIGKSVTVTGGIQPSAPAVTPGSGTGVTVNDSGSVRDLTYKVTVLSTQFIAAATTADFTALTLPANTRVLNVDASINTTFACASTCTTSTLSLILGKGAGGAEYLASFDADAATGWFGDADAELGTLMTRAAAIQGGTFSTGSQAVVLRLTSGTGNIGTGAATNLSQGSVTIYVTTRVMP